jgi:hypothetical protein
MTLTLPPLSNRTRGCERDNDACIRGEGIVAKALLARGRVNDVAVGMGGEDVVVIVILVGRYFFCFFPPVTMGDVAGLACHHSFYPAKKVSLVRNWYKVPGKIDNANPKILSWRKIYYSAI